MIFKHYNGDIRISKSKLNDGLHITELDKLIVSSRKILKSMKIDTQNKYVFYKRNMDGESVLGIQLVSGDMEDITNYIVFDQKVYQYGEFTRCGCDMHVDAKASKTGNEFATYSVDSISSFFTNMENDLVKNGQTKRDFDCMKSLDSKKGKENPLTKLFRRK